jgi:pheromone shutdown-related protein TraB
VVEVGERTYHLLGTAHVSRASVDAVREAIHGLEPDCVCVELDEKRLEALRNPTEWDKLNLGKALRQGKGPFLLANLAMSAFQRRLGLSTGVKPGEELAQAVKVAEEHGITVDLCDRNIRHTLLRAWRLTGFWRKLWLVSTLIASAFDDTEIDEEELKRLRSSDTLSGLMEEMGKVMPSVKRILIDERDTYMAGRLQRAEGQKILAVVGAGHVQGMIKALQTHVEDDHLAELDVIPAKSLVSRIIPWAIPAVVIALFVVGFFWGDASKIQEAALAWVLANGILSSLGAALAFGHPVTIVSAFIAAPLTSLNPTIGAGMVAGAVQAWIGKPQVSDAEGLADDLTNWRGWWTNRVSRVLLVFFLSSLGSAIGTFVAFGWIKDLV